MSKNASNFISDFNGSTNVNEFIDLINYYSNTLKDDTEKNRFVDFLFNVSLKGPAKNTFIKNPSSLKDLSEKLLSRFRGRDTVSSLQGEIGKCTKGSRSVSKFVSELENLGNKLSKLQIKKVLYCQH